MKETIGIITKDVAYGSALAKAAKENEKYFMVFFSTEEEFFEYRQENSVEVILIGREMEEDILEKTEGVKKIYLSEIKGFSRINNYPAIYKYQPVSKIIEEVELHREEKISDGQHLVMAQRTAFIGIMSPVGQCLKTEFALLLGQLFSEKAKTLYVNFEICSGFSSLFYEEFPYDLSDFLYALESVENQEFTETVSEMIGHFHGLDIIAPPSLAEDLYKTKPEVFNTLMMKLAKECAYDIVILDLGNSYGIGELLLPSCRKVYVPGKRDEVSKKKIQEFELWLEEKFGNAFLEREERLIIPTPHLYCPGKDSLEQLLFSETGDYIRKTVDGMY